MSDSDLVDILDENGNLTGKSAAIKQVHTDSLWHGASHVWIYSPTGKILMQKRSMLLDNLPGQWDISAAGHIDAGETGQVAAVREIAEELGVKIDVSQLELLKRFKMITPYKKFKTSHREFWSVYVLELPEETPIVFDKKEVDAVKWLDYKMFLKFSAETAFAKQKDYYQLITTELSKRVNKTGGDI